MNLAMSSFTTPTRQVTADHHVPVMHLLAGPNGSGKSSYVEDLLGPETHLAFINADILAKDIWPHAQAEHAYEASRLAAEQRDGLLRERKSFITETVFSHVSKLQLVRQALELGYLVHLHVMLLPVELTVIRVHDRVSRGGHTVPEQKVRERYMRLWELIAQARDIAQRADFFDNSDPEHPFRLVAQFEHGSKVGQTSWPFWTPEILIQG